MKLVLLPFRSPLQDEAFDKGQRRRNAPIELVVAACEIKANSLIGAA